MCLLLQDVALKGDELCVGRGDRCFGSVHLEPLVCSRESRACHVRVAAVRSYLLDDAMGYVESSEAQFTSEPAAGVRGASS